MTAFAQIAPDEDERAAAPAARALEIPLSALAWGAVALGFLLLRLGPTWQAPVAGAELVHLSGAWQARIGVDDSRFVPTLFQALTALLLRFSTSEVPARVLAFVVTGTIPAALYFLRRKLGQGGALVALLLLAVDAPAISLGAGASAMAADLALITWLFWLFTRERPEPPPTAAWAEAAGTPSPVRQPLWAWGLAAFLVVLSGPLTLPLLAAALAIRLARRQYPSQRQLAWGAGGAALGIAVASLQFGLGPGGLRIPPLDLFGASFTQTWSTATGFEVIALYDWPILAGGLAAAGWYAWRWWAWREIDDTRLLLLVWTLFALGWAIAAGNEHSFVASVALVVPLTLLLGTAIVEASGAMLRADWSIARFALPAAGFLVVTALSFMLDWARAGQPGNAGDKTIVVLLVAAAAVMLGVVAFHRRARPALFAFALAAAVFPLLPGTFGVGLSAVEEPIPSPMSPPQARALRDLALQTVAERPGLIIIHPDFKDALTWPFRDSGSIVISSRVPPDASVVIWPLDAAQPERMTRVEGDWNVRLEVPPPTGDPLKCLRWLTNRNNLTIKPTRVAVYTAVSP